MPGKNWQCWDCKDRGYDSIERSGSAGAGAGARADDKESDESDKEEEEESPPVKKAKPNSYAAAIPVKKADAMVPKKKEHTMSVFCSKCGSFGKLVTVPKPPVPIIASKKLIADALKQQIEYSDKLKEEIVQLKKKLTEHISSH